MNAQNYSINFLFNIPQAGIEIKKSDVSANNSGSSFRAMLDERMSNPVGKADYTKEAASGRNSITASTSLKRFQVKEPENVSNKQEVREKVQYKRYTEIERDNKVQSKAEPETGSGVNGKKAAEAEEGKTEESIAVESLAGVLGLKPEEMTKLLETIGIKPEELTDASKVESVVNKLADFLNLSDQQKATLASVINEVKTAIDEIKAGGNQEPDKQQIPVESKEGKVIQNKAESFRDTVKIENENIQVVSVQESEEGSEKGLQQIAGDLKQKLDELTKQLQQNPKKLLTEVSEKVKAVVEEAGTAMSEEIPETDAGEATVLKGQKSVNDTEEVKRANSTEKKGAAEENIRVDEKGSTESMKDNPENKLTASETKGSNFETVKSDSNGEIQFNSLIQDRMQKNGDVKEAAKVFKDVPVQKSDIINQVVEKAKVVMTGDKSEMVMDLKPDSLGKISMKIVTERGIVVAKFVAESQQVKEVLESNMQLLKDSLEKQGLSVQGFSVSVDQNPYKGFNMNQMNQGNSSRGGNSNRNLTSMDSGQTVRVSDTFEAKKVSNPYEWSESKINLTA